MWFIKIIRSGARDAQGNLPPEVWAQGGVCPTLNQFDNTGESRATILILDGTRVGDVRVYEDDIMQTVISRWGTGGGNVPYVYPIQGTVIGRSDTAGPQGKGFGEDGGPMYTIDTVGGHGVATDSVVRRLTPVECERLQGFPDGWTDGQADSHRYKQMGNAVTVNVIEWIGNRL